MITLLFLMGLLFGLVAPQVAQVPPGVAEYVGTLVSTAATVIAVSGFVVSRLGLKKFAAQAASWVVTALVVFASAYFDVGYFAHASTFIAVCNGVAVALLANRLFDAGTLEHFLNAFGLVPKRE